MVSVKCPNCERSFPSYSALVAHLQEEREMFVREIKRNQESESKEDKRLTDLRVQVESARLKRELREIEKGQPQVKEKSTLDQFTELEKFRSAIVETEEKKRSAIKDLVKEEIESLGEEGQDPALPLIKEIIAASAKQKQQGPGLVPNIMSADKINPQTYTKDQLIAGVPDQIKKQIKAGKITKQQAATWAKSQHITKEQFEAVWQQLSSKDHKA